MRGVCMCMRYCKLRSGKRADRYQVYDTLTERLKARRRLREREREKMCNALFIILFISGYVFILFLYKQIKGLPQVYRCVSILTLIFFIHVVTVYDKELESTIKY